MSKEIDHTDRQLLVLEKDMISLQSQPTRTLDLFTISMKLIQLHIKVNWRILHLPTDSIIHIVNMIALFIKDKKSITSAVTVKDPEHTLSKELLMWVTLEIHLVQLCLNQTEVSLMKSIFQMLQKIKTNCH